MNDDHFSYIRQLKQKALIPTIWIFDSYLGICVKGWEKGALAFLLAFCTTQTGLGPKLCMITT